METMGSKLDSNELAKHFRTAHGLADVAEKMCILAESKGFTRHQKGDKTWVTEADLEIETKLRQILAKETPDIEVLGEEHGGEPLRDDGKLRWVLDPIDGTFSFVHGVPFYSSLIALCKGLTPVIGIASLPAMNIRMSAFEGGGAFIGEHKFTKSALVGAPQVELFSTADHYRFEMESKQKTLQLLLKSPLRSRVYCDALGYYLLLRGNIRAFVDPKAEVWDVAPFHCILKEAGFAIHAWNDPRSGLTKGTSVAYAVGDGGPVNCSDILNCLGPF
jgi:fructose-1,6-bisphosphatase/inositol monophosphatase family enzyme